MFAARMTWTSSHMIDGRQGRKGDLPVEVKAKTESNRHHLEDFDRLGCLDIFSQHTAYVGGRHHRHWGLSCRSLSFFDPVNYSKVLAKDHSACIARCSFQKHATLQIAISSRGTPTDIYPCHPEGRKTGWRICSTKTSTMSISSS